jgi:hypothetical protein
MEEAVMMVDKTTNKSLRPKSVAQMQWLPSGNKYSYVSSNKLFILTLEEGKLDTSINLKVLNSAILLLDKKLKFELLEKNKLNHHKYRFVALPISFDFKTKCVKNENVLFIQYDGINKAIVV